MDKLPQREDLIYKEIEEFQNYELTNCIAYEMAVRNQEIIELRILSNRILILFHKKMFNKLKEGVIFEDLEIKYPNMFYFCNIREKVNNELKTNYFFDNDYFEIKEMNNLIDKDFIIKEDMVNELIAERDANLKVNSNYIKPLYNSKIKNGYIIEQKLKSDLRSVIKTNFRKQLPLPIEYDNQISIIINPNLPKEELIAYISKIKDDFDKDNSIIKTPLELLGETLEKSDNKKIPKKPKASVYADWFYIYDYWKYEKTQGKTDKDIFVALEVENDVPYKEDMLRKIRDKMKYFIDDLGYKELITGVKNT